MAAEEKHVWVEGVSSSVLNARQQRKKWRMWVELSHAALMVLEMKLKSVTEGVSLSNRAEPQPGSDHRALVYRGYG